MASDKRALSCLRCGAEMEFSARKQFQLGEESPYSGIRAMMDAQSLTMEIYKCPSCGKMEFFDPSLPKVAAPAATNWTCPECGTYNSHRVHACQGCGVSRQWLESRRSKT